MAASQSLVVVPLGVHLTGVEPKAVESGSIAFCGGRRFPRPPPVNGHARRCPPPKPRPSPSPVVVLSTPPRPPPLRPLRAHPPLHPTAISGSRIYHHHLTHPRSLRFNPKDKRNLLQAYSRPITSPAAISQPLDIHPSHHHTKAPPGADTLLRCCYPREASHGSRHRQSSLQLAWYGGSSHRHG